MFDDTAEKKKHRLVFEKVARAIQENPDNFLEKMDKLGFRWVDDEVDDEDVEEKAATIRNDSEKRLVGYFEGEIDLSDQVLDTYLAETASDSLNIPLLKSYFKKGNERLKELLLYGLEKRPTDIDLLSDLAYYHDFRNVLGELIQAYLRACEKESDPDRFSQMVMSFCLDTEPDGFDAFHELEHVYRPGSSKWTLIQSVRRVLESELDCIAA